MAKTNTYQAYKPRVDLIRLLVCAALACVMMLIMFFIYKDNIAETIKELEAKKDHANTIWFIKNVGAAIPTYASIIVMCIAYGNKTRSSAAQIQREKLYVAIILAVFTFLMFTFVRIMDGNIAGGDGVESLLERTFSWFVAQILPLAVLISYHAVRLGTEERLLEAEADK
jgi:hypothetical protein